MELLKKYESEKHNLKDWEVLESDLITEIIEQHSQYSWYGIKSLSIVRTILQDDTILFILKEEETTEIVRQDKDADTIYSALINLTGSGDFLPVAAFQAIEETEKHINENYKVIDLEIEVRNIINKIKK